MKGIQCKKCAHFTPEWCEFKRDSLDPDLMRDCKYYKVKTNADRIRSMSNEEMVDWWHDWCSGVTCLDPDCRKCLLKWLKQEAE